MNRMVVSDSLQMIDMSLAGVASALGLALVKISLCQNPCLVKRCTEFGLTQGATLAFSACFELLRAQRV